MAINPAPELGEKPYGTKLLAHIGGVINPSTGELRDEAVEAKVAAAIAAEPTVVAAAEAAVDATGVATAANRADTRVVDVRKYGAVGNGIADDTTAINNAAAALSSRGGVVYFPPGAYKITSAITAAANKRIVWQGAGPRASIILAVGCSGFDLQPASVTENHWWWTFTNLAIRGDYTADKHGIIIKGMHHFRMQNVQVERFAGHGLYIPADTYRGIVWGCEFQDNNGDGINFGTGVNGNWIYGCELLHNGGAGMRFGTGLGRCFGVGVTNCLIEGNMNGGIITGTVDGLSVVGCYFEVNALNRSNNPGGRGDLPLAEIGYHIQLGVLPAPATSTKGVSITGCFFSGTKGVATSGDAYDIQFGHPDTVGVEGVFLGGNTHAGNTNQKTAYYQELNSRSVTTLGNNYDRGEGGPTIPKTHGSDVFAGTTGKTITHNIGTTKSVISITPTYNMAGRWYITKTADSFTVYSTDAADTGSFDYCILVRGSN